MPTRRARRYIALLLLIGTLVLLGRFGRLGDRFILWPSTAPLDAHGAQRVMIPFGDGELELWRASSSPQMPKAFVLRFYGNADRADRWVAGEAASWSEQPLEVWGVNYPGYGGSTGPARLQGVADSALAAYDALRAVAGTRPIFVFGTSLGTTAALHVAAERSVAGVVLQNPPALRELILGDQGWWNLWLLAYPASRQIPATLDSVSNARRSRCRAVVLLAEQDDVVRPKYQRMVVEAFAGPKEVLVQTGARHNTPMNPEFARSAHAAVARLFSKGL